MKNKLPKLGYSEYDNFAFHPYNIMLSLLLLAITMLFLALSGAFVYTRVQSGVGALEVPLLFFLNTLVLLSSSYSMVKAKKAYLNDETRSYQNSLRYTIGLTVLFLALQFWAWSMLFNNNVFPTTDNSAGYLYMLSGLHFAHVIAGLPFLIQFLRISRRQMVDPVTVLVYFSDPEKRLRLRLLSIYWHFLDALWVALVLFLFINQLF
ncbi:MAG: cytochrome c oxidase subunit 3 [Saprospiraceae bacterium]|nr:cytochrome c oxidase subunit 3 [Saprospiraceae bacterium]MCF8249264.1 cytochrome c oxidase subunit 3 [Saprospiraceae bacterium]MCF8281168.1 cytochrome c oxidase subunit 3 [Bacteroidales bacterium]MCF8311459.1 cytochrome c oxidase subunit 3 [Saprospiraceae bacterium]MCF8439883.1 cytochrome c oxidase subunit 3 [Saprospiraceae bacterium]